MEEAAEKAITATVSRACWRTRGRVASSRIAGVMLIGSTLRVTHYWALLVMRVLT